MPQRHSVPILTLCVCLFAFFGSSTQAHAHALEIFAKASASKNYSAADTYTVSVQGATGLAILLIPQIRIEGRYTVVSSLQNRLNVSTPDIQATLNDIKTQTNIYSVMLDIDILSDKFAVQPYVLVGAGYIETTRSYYVSVPTVSTSTYISEPKETGISTNVGAGFRVHIARSVAFEVEAYGYGVNIQKPNPLVNLSASAGIRIFM